MSELCTRIAVFPADEDEGPRFLAVLAPRAPGAEAEHLRLMTSPAPSDWNRTPGWCFVDWGCHIDQSMGAYGVLAAYEISPDRRTLSLTLDLERYGSEFHAFTAPEPLGPEVDAVLEAIRTSRWDPVSD